MTGQTIILRDQKQRDLAKRMIDQVPDGVVLAFKKQTRSLNQNAKLWAMLSDVSRSKPEGRQHTTEVWKCLFMQACGHEVQFLQGLDGHPFPAGFKSSKLNKPQMSDLIEFIHAWGTEHGVCWSDEWENAA